MKNQNNKNERQDEASSLSDNKNASAISGLSQSTGSELNPEDLEDHQCISTDHTHTSDNTLSIFSPSFEPPSDHQSSIDPEDEKILWRLQGLLGKISARAQGDFSE